MKNQIIKEHIRSYMQGTLDTLNNISFLFNLGDIKTSRQLIQEHVQNKRLTFHKWLNDFDNFFEKLGIEETNE
jgi:hypothetical protein